MAGTCLVCHNHNHDIAADYFDNNPYPRYAIEMDNKDDCFNQHAPGFNLPDHH
jgi:hypothetical protein